MNRVAKILFIVFFGVVFVAALISFYRYFILKDYYITAEVDCDPQTEKCFIYGCSPEDDETCPENPDERISYYKLIKKKASIIPLCDPAKEDCPALTCQKEEDCQEILCDDSTKAKSEECNNPEEYIKENPEDENEGSAEENENLEQNGNNGQEETSGNEVEPTNQ